MKKRCLFGITLVLWTISLLMPLRSDADEGMSLSNGQLIYVPAYSHIYMGNNERPFLLAITLSIRNIDPGHKIIINAVNYHASQGKQIKKYMDTPIVLTPLESLRYIVPEKDKSGGSGANFIVEWKSDRAVNPPIVESIMIGTQSGQGVSFTSRGRVLFQSK
jgi:hypothetical protein